jgi:hypothetical protein
MTQDELATVPLREIVSSAWQIGKTINLDGVGYGKVHWGEGKQIITSPFAYYFFLAGIVRLTGARSIIEIGTHQGGSTKAILAGIKDLKGSSIVTFDVTPYGAAIFEDHPVVKAYAMDANSPEAHGIARRNMRPDLVFIDTTHRYETTKQSFQYYGVELGARFILLDDIALNDEMRLFWTEVVSSCDAADASLIEPIRPPTKETIGFGIVRCTPVLDSTDPPSVSSVEL